MIEHASSYLFLCGVELVNGADDQSPLHLLRPREYSSGYCSLCRRTFNPKENQMNKDETIQAQVAAVQAGELEALTAALVAAYDAGAASVPTTPGGFTQSDIDSAVAAERARDKAIVEGAEAQIDPAPTA